MKKIQQDKGLPVKEVTLHLDVKTRWNSIIVMLDSILKVETYFQGCRLAGASLSRGFLVEPEPNF